MADDPNASNESVAPDSPYEKMAFEEFLKAIGNHNVRNWTMLADALGVSRATIYRWKQHPLAQEAITSAIEESIRKMGEVGFNDWRMWREKAKMLGVRDITTLEHEAGDSVKSLLDGIEQTDYDKLRSKADGQVVAYNASVQDQK